MTWGYNDNVCPPTTSYIVWNLITAPKESLITPINKHWTSETTNYGQMVWLKIDLQDIASFLRSTSGRFACKERHSPNHQ